MILQAPNSSLWDLEVTPQGILTTTHVTQGSGVTLVLIASDNSYWLLGVDNNGLLTTTSTTSNPFAVPFQQLTAPDNSVWRLEALPGGILETIEGSGCTPPVPVNVKETVFGNVVIIHEKTGFPVEVLADYSLYCCALLKFVLPEDTTIIEVLDE